MRLVSFYAWRFGICIAFAALLACPACHSNPTQGGSLRLQAPKAVAHLAPLNQPSSMLCGPDGYCLNGTTCDTLVGSTADSYSCCLPGSAPASMGQGACESAPVPP